MTPEEMRALLQRVGQNTDNQALVTELLTQAGDAFAETHTRNETLEGQQADHTKQIDELQKANMNLFLKVGNPVKSENLNNAGSGQDQQLTYDDVLQSFGVGNEEGKKVD